MTYEEKLISCCKYYKGEEELPFKFGSKEGIFWDTEKMTVNIFLGTEEFANTDDLEYIRKNIKSFVSALNDKWRAYDTKLMSAY